MKNINPKAITIKKALCPFCSYGCEFGVIYDDFGIKGVEYAKDGSSGGRLCPRGSAAAMYLNHPRRLAVPMKDGKPVAWAKMKKDLTKVFGSPKSTAVTFDRNVTPEEYAAIIGFCEKVGIENIASTYFEPESHLEPFLDESFDVSNLQKTQLVVILGDPFNQTPMVSQAIIDWKLKDRKNGLIVIDSLHTHTAGFADQFLRVNVGTEPLLLFALAQKNFEGIDATKVTGIDRAIIKDVSRRIKDSKNSIVFACLSFGHTYDPALCAEGISELEGYGRMKIVPLVEFAGYEGNKGFGSIMEMAKKKKIKYLVNFGELFPFYYPQVAPDLKNLEMYATSTLKHSGYTMVPVPLTLEKEGTVYTSFGKKKLLGGIEPPSGARSIEEIIGPLSGGSGKGKQLSVPDHKLDIKERARRISEATLVKGKGLRLMGEKIAFNFLGFFEEASLKMNPADAMELNIASNDIVKVTSKQGVEHMTVRLTEDVSQGVVTVPAETPGARKLFEYDIDTDLRSVNFIPTEVKICREE
ncbi:MAG: hypothetical protein JSW49_01400 [candidate division WOR-3 bacterium]|nr:MAG: hypothetical protein JSW49_01400 [candidate division WOR-3 bacterium]